MLRSQPTEIKSAWQWGSKAAASTIFQMQKKAHHFFFLLLLRCMLSIFYLTGVIACKFYYENPTSVWPYAGRQVKFKPKDYCGYLYYFWMLMNFSIKYWKYCLLTKPLAFDKATSQLIILNYRGNSYFLKCLPVDKLYSNKWGLP